MYVPPTWLKLTAAKVRADSRLQPHMIVSVFDEAAMDADITSRIPTVAGNVMRRIGNATRALGVGYELTDAQKDSIIEAVKLKVIRAITQTDPTELVATVSKACKEDANEILVELENEFEQLAKAAQKSASSSGTVRFSRYASLPRDAIDRLLSESGLTICRNVDDEY